MLHLKNIKKNENLIEADYAPECRGEYGHIKIDLSNEDNIEIVKTPMDKDSNFYIAPAIGKLYDLSEKDDIPNELKLVWY